LVEGERAEAYGDCVALHHRVAQLFNAYMDGKVEASAYDAAVFLMLVKIARMRHKPSTDSHIDIAGYASICQTIFEEEEEGKAKPSTSPSGKPVRSEYELKSQW
jgi:hypothetical protein